MEGVDQVVKEDNVDRNTIDKKSTNVQSNPIRIDSATHRMREDVESKEEEEDITGSFPLKRNSFDLSPVSIWIEHLHNHIHESGTVRDLRRELDEEENFEKLKHIFEKVNITVERK